MKYAIWIPTDQTICYIENDDGGETCKHPEVKLWNTYPEAKLIVDKLNGFDPDPHSTYYVEEVKDEVEFRSREDTW